MDIYEARWQNAKKIAERIIEMQSNGWLIFDGENKIAHKFAIEKDSYGKDRIVERYDGITIEYFANDRDWDAGLYTTIAEYNKQFAGWKCIDPKNIVPLLLE